MTPSGEDQADNLHDSDMQGPDHVLSQVRLANPGDSRARTERRLLLKTHSVIGWWRSCDL